MSHVLGTLCAIKHPKDGNWLKWTDTDEVYTDKLFYGLKMYLANVLQKHMVLGGKEKDSFVSICQAVFMSEEKFIGQITLLPLYK